VGAERTFLPCFCCAESQHTGGVLGSDLPVAGRKAARKLWHEGIKATIDIPCVPDFAEAADSRGRQRAPRERSTCGPVITSESARRIGFAVTCCPSVELEPAVSVCFRFRISEDQVGDHLRSLRLQAPG
jgi:hypothetical protein